MAIYTKIKHTTNVQSVEVLEVIMVVSRVGKGTDDDVVRMITEYYDRDGRLLARVDPYSSEASTIK